MIKHLVAREERRKKGCDCFPSPSVNIFKDLQGISFHMLKGKPRPGPSCAYFPWENVGLGCPSAFVLDTVVITGHSVFLVFVDDFYGQGRALSVQGWAVSGHSFELPMLTFGWVTSGTSITPSSICPPPFLVCPLSWKHPIFLPSVETHNEGWGRFLCRLNNWKESVVWLRRKVNKTTIVY